MNSVNMTGVIIKKNNDWLILQVKSDLFSCKMAQPNDDLKIRDVVAIQGKLSTTVCKKQVDDITITIPKIFINIIDIEVIGNYQQPLPQSQYQKQISSSEQQKSTNQKAGKVNGLAATHSVANLPFN